MVVRTSLMPQQLLDGPDVVTVLQPVCRKRNGARCVASLVCEYRLLGHASLTARLDCRFV